MFTAPMVRALPPGPKTMTRRALDRQPPEECGIHYMLGNESWLPEDQRTPLRHHWEAWGGPLYEQRPEGYLCGTHSVRCPYGAPGDHLWVRETFFAWGRWETRFNAKKGRDEWHFVDMTLECGRVYVHAADGQPSGYVAPDRGGVGCGWWKRPAIFMPRVASRITLEITEVRVERLQDISEADAQAEGTTPIPDPCDHVRLACADIGCGGPQPYRTGFRSLWQDINGPGSWDANPWVWAVSFRRLP